MRRISVILLFISFVLASCQEQANPKPRAFFDLNYAPVPYKEMQNNLPHKFSYSEQAELVVKTTVLTSGIQK